MTVNGRSSLEIRDYTSGHRSTLGLSASLAVICRSREQHEVRLLIEREVLRMGGEPRGLWLGKPFLLIIRDERLVVV